MDKAEARKLALKEMARRELQRRQDAAPSEPAPIALGDHLRGRAREVFDWIDDNPSKVLPIAMGPIGSGAATVAGRMAGSGAAMGFADTAGQYLEEGVIDPVRAGISTVAGAGGQALGEIAGMAGPAVKKILGGGDDAAKRMKAFADSGAAPTAGQVSSSPSLRNTEAFVGRLPGGRGKLAEAYEAVDEKLGNSLSKILGEVEIDDEAAGRAIKGGIDKWLSRTEAKADGLYGQVRKAIPGDTALSIANLRQTLGDLATEGGDLGASLVHPKIKQLASTIAEAAPQGQVPAAALFKLRSQIGRLIGSTRGVNDDIPRAELKRVYAALSDDIKDAASAAGPDTLAAFNRANNFYRARMRRIDDHLGALAKKVSPEDAYQAAIGGRKRGTTRLRAIRRSLDADEWKTVAKSVVEKMGRAAPHQQGVDGDAFSPIRFLTEWNRLPKSTKEALFSGNLRGDLDRIARSAAAVKGQSKALANPSGTGMVNMAVAPLAAGGATFAGTGDVQTSALVALGSLGVGNSASRLMTSPRFVRWLASSSAIKPNKSVAYVARLGALNFGDDPELQQAVRDFISEYDRTAPIETKVRVVTR